MLPCPWEPYLGLELAVSLFSQKSSFLISMFEKMKSIELCFLPPLQGTFDSYSGKLPSSVSFLFTSHWAIVKLITAQERKISCPKITQAVTTTTPCQAHEGEGVSSHLTWNTLTPMEPNGAYV